MTQRHVLIMALLSGSVLAFFSAGLHECALDAGEAEVRVACRTLCALSDKAGPKESVGGDLGQMVSTFKGVACTAMSDEAPQLLACRDVLLPKAISVADYHCLRDAETLAQAKDCEVF